MAPAQSRPKHCCVSPIHHYFEVYGLGEKGCALHRDNCGGQNKNKTVLAYHALRCMVSLHGNIQLSFMIAGHTSSLMDGCLGSLKHQFCRSDCHSMRQLANVVNASAKYNRVQLIPGSGLRWQEWDKFLLQSCKPIPGISKLHHWRFSSRHPGMISRGNVWMLQRERDLPLEVSSTRGCFIHSTSCSGAWRPVQGDISVPVQSDLTARDGSAQG